MTGIGENVAIDVAIVGGLAGSFVVVMAGLRDELVDNAVQISHDP